jgi:hypothetical protein
MATASDTGNPPRPLAPGLGWVTKFLSFLYPTRAECNKVALPRSDAAHHSRFAEI